MADKVISLELDVQIKNAQSVEELEKVIKDIEKSIGKRKQYGVAFDDLTAAAEKAKGKLTELGGAAKELNTKVSATKPAAEIAGRGFQSMNASLKSLATSMLGPIGLGALLTCFVVKSIPGENIHSPEDSTKSPIYSESV